MGRGVRRNQRPVAALTELSGSSEMEESDGRHEVIQTQILGQPR